MKKKYIIPTIRVFHAAYKAILLYSVNVFQEQTEVDVGDYEED